MDDLPPPRERTASRENARRAWIIGGALLIFSTVSGAVIEPMLPYIPGLGYTGGVVYAVSLLIFAFGIRGAGSVTARRPLGTGAMTGLAVWTLVQPALNGIVYSDFDGEADLVGLQQSFGYIDLLLRFILALIAATQIARAGIVPAPWNWVPAWCLAAVTLTFLLLQGTALEATQDATFAMSTLTLDVAVRAGAAVLLGVLSIVLANRSMPPRTVSVFRSSDPTG